MSLGASRVATDEVLAENQFNEPPPEGYDFVIVPATLENAGIAPEAPWLSVDLAAVSDSNVEASSDCGVVPKEFDSLDDVFPGGKATINFCFVVLTKQVDTLVVYAKDLFDQQPVAFATSE